MAELKELMQNPDPMFHATYVEDNLYDWHFTIRGAVDSEFEGGLYHGRIVLPAEYPFKPPDIYFFTPSGRFETNTKICLSISGFHPKTWQPSWGLRTILTATIAFMLTPGEGALGALDWSRAERQRLAALSVDYCCPVCGKKNSEILPRMTKEELAAACKALPPSIPLSSTTGGAGTPATGAQVKAPGGQTPLSPPLEGDRTPVSPAVHEQGGNVPRPQVLSSSAGSSSSSDSNLAALLTAHDRSQATALSVLGSVAHPETPQPAVHSEATPIPSPIALPMPTPERAFDSPQLQPLVEEKGESSSTTATAKPADPLSRLEMVRPNASRLGSLYGAPTSAAKTGTTDSASSSGPVSPSTTLGETSAKEQRSHDSKALSPESFSTATVASSTQVTSTPVTPASPSQAPPSNGPAVGLSRQRSTEEVIRARLAALGRSPSTQTLGAKGSMSTSTTANPSALSSSVDTSAAGASEGPTEGTLKSRITKPEREPLMPEHIEEVRSEPLSASAALVRPSVEVPASNVETKQEAENQAHKQNAELLDSAAAPSASSQPLIRRQDRSRLWRRIHLFSIVFVFCLILIMVKRKVERHLVRGPKNKV